MQARLYTVKQDAPLPQALSNLPCDSCDSSLGDTILAVSSGIWLVLDCAPLPARWARASQGCLDQLVVSCACVWPLDEPALYSGAADQLQALSEE